MTQPSGHNIVSITINHIDRRYITFIIFKTTIWLYLSIPRCRKITVDVNYNTSFQLPTPWFCIYALITTPWFINPLPLWCHCLHLDWLRRLRPLVSNQENRWILKFQNISRFSAVFLKSCWGVVMDYIFINFIEKKRKTLGKW